MLQDQQIDFCKRLFRVAQPFSKQAEMPDNPVNPGRVPQSNPEAYPTQENLNRIKSGLLYGGAGGAALGGLYSLISGDTTTSKALRNVLIGGVGGAAAGAGVASIPMQLHIAGKAMEEDKANAGLLDANTPGIETQVARSIKDLPFSWLAHVAAPLAVAKGVTAPYEQLPDTHQYRKWTLDAGAQEARATDALKKRLEAESTAAAALRAAEKENALVDARVKSIKAQLGLPNAKNTSKLQISLAEEEAKLAQANKALTAAQAAHHAAAVTPAARAELEDALLRAKLNHAMTAKRYDLPTAEQEALLAAKLHPVDKLGMRALRFGSRLRVSPRMTLPIAAAAAIESPWIWDMFSSKK